MKKILFVFSILFSVKTSFAQTPGTPANNLTFTTIGLTSLSFTWTRGSGDACLVTIRPTANAVAYPTNSTSQYATSSVYGNGANLGNNNFCVYKGTGTSLTVTGLANYTQYTVSIYEYNYPAFPYINYMYLTSPYEFATHYTLTAEPTVQASALTPSAITSAGANLTWTSGNGTYELASLRQSTANANTPVDGNAYISSTTFGSGSTLGSGAPYSYVIYVSSGNTVAVTGCSPATDYVANCFTYNGLAGGQNYLLTGYPTAGFTTLATQPTGNCNSSYFTDVTNNAMTVHWIRPTTGAGSKVIVTMRAAAAADLPVNQNNYTANSVFGSGSAIGSSYVVYTGTSNTVRVTGLTANTLYYVAIVEYNGGPGTYNPTNNYASSYLTGNKYTLPAEPTTNASNLNFSNIQTNQVTASWTNGDGPYRVVAVRPGRLQTALAFDGTNDYVSVPFNAVLQPTAAVTIEAWAYKADWANSVGWQTIAGNYETQGYELFSYYGQIYGYAYAGGTTGYAYSDVSWLAPGWHHFAFTSDGRYTRIYVDGAEKNMRDAGAANTITYSYSNSFIIGASAGTATSPSGNYFNGYIDNVRVWNSVQSVGTIRANMNKTMNGNESGLIAEWNLNDGYATSTAAANNSLNYTALNGTLLNFGSTVAASSFTGTSGWIKSGATVDLPTDYSFVGSSTVLGSGGQIGNKYYSVYWGGGTTVTVTGLSPNTYYDFYVVEDNYPSYDNYQTSTYLMGDVLTASQPLPTITSFSPASGAVGTLVTINGTNFDVTAANNKVYFGTEQATVISSTATQIIAVLPYCTNNVPISVTVNTLSAYSAKPFIVTNACPPAITNASFTGSTTLAGTAKMGVAAGDLDLDGKTDALVCDYSGNYFTAIRNLSSNGSISWGTSINKTTGASPYEIKLGDIDGDKKLDPVVACNGINRINVFRNISATPTINFNPGIDLPTLANPTSISISDIDKDGKPDIVVGYNSVSTLYFSVFRNTSSSGFISFATRLDFSSTYGSYDIATADMDGDGKEDVVTTGGYTYTYFSAFRNTSTPANISFEAEDDVLTVAGGNVISIALADMDNNGKIDVVAGLFNNTLRVYNNLNSSGSITPGNFSLVAGMPLTTLANYPYGLGVYDLDGDGRHDISVGYSGTGQVSVFEQTASFTFAARVDLAAASGSSSYFLAPADFSLDGKTDLITNSNSTALNVYNNAMNPIYNPPGPGEPTTAASNITFSGVSQTSMTVNFTAGNGVNRIVIARQGSPVTAVPFDGTGYTANPVFGSGTDLGGGQYVVYNSNSNSVVVTNLLSYTTYYFAVYEYNGTTCTANYLTSPFASNGTATLNTPPTLAAISNPAAICQNSGLQSVNLSGIGTGAGNETQTLSVTATSNNQTLIPNANISLSYSSPNPTGSVLYTPAAGQSGTAVITVTVNDNATNNNTIAKSFTVTVTAAPTTANAGSNMTICNSFGALTANTPAVGTGSWTITYSSNGAISIVSPTSASTSIINFNVNDTVRLAWTISNAPCSPSVSNISVVRKLCPLTADFAANQTDYCGTSASVTFTDQSSVPNPNSIVKWEWSFPGGAPSTYTSTVSGNPSSAISYTASGTYNVSLKVTDNTAGTDTKLKTSYITITALPGTATTISGSTTPCQGASVNYSVSPIAGANSYTWTVPSGAIVNTGQGNAAITVDYGVNASSGNVTVQGFNSCGGGGTYSLPITISPLPGATSTISGPASVCPNASGVVFSVAAIPAASTYSWTLPSGASIVGPNTGSSITVNFSNAASGMVDVLGNNACGYGTSSNGYLLNVLPLPDVAGSISGTTTVCQGDTVVYSIAALGNTNSYAWNIPAGASIVGVSNTNAITVVYGSSAVSGNVSVNGINSCGNGTAASLPVTVNPLPVNATSIIGSTTVCAGDNSETYFVSAINNATSYSWTLPAGFNIIGPANTNAIQVSLDPLAQSGIISVYGTNACGNGVASTFSVTVSPLPDSANTIAGPATVCQGQTGVVFSVPAITNSTGYNWAFPTGTSVVSGLNTNTITVDFSNTAVAGFVTVIGTNSCGNGLSVDSFAVSVNPLPSAAGTILGDSAILICPVQTGFVYTVGAVSNATGYNWTVPTGATITGGANTNTITVDYTVSSQNGNITVTPTNACGNGIVSAKMINIDTVQSQNICITTVDSLTSTKNIIVWEKPVSLRIDSFRIYREIAGAFKQVGNVGYTSLSLFTDNTNGINPQVTSYKYKVAAIDTCGNESPLSTFHQTMHLQVGPASPCGYNLSWNDYIGIPVTQYRIMRDTIGTGIYYPADSVSFGNNSWTDIKCYKITDTVSYYIEIDHPGTCTATVKNNPFPLATKLHSSKSNVYRIADTTVTGIIGVSDNYLVSVLPNPNNGLFTIELNNNISGGVVQVFNLLGEQVIALSLIDGARSVQLDMRGTAKGVYHVQYTNQNYRVNKKIIIQ